MRVGIIGFGYVGQAIGWAYRDHDLIINDPKLSGSANLDKFIDRDAIFICVPSPSTEDGHCDSSILEETLKNLLFITISNPDIVIISKTTATPQIYKKLQQQYPNLVHAPEFLTQENNTADYANARYCVLGGNYDWCVKARKIIIEGRRLTHDKHIITTIETASLYKYMMNSYLATKVTFMNDWDKIATAEGVSLDDLRHIASHEDRIGTTHMQVPGPDGHYGWGGACFPKDIAAILEEGLDLGVELELLGRVEDINKKHRKLK
jgi:nucleotide sugar dehydrogenase